MVTTLRLTSSEFNDGASIPPQFTCDATSTDVGLNPPLAMHDVPPGTMSLALIMDDPDVPGGGVFDHWILYNIPPATTEITTGETIGTPGKNSAGKNAYYPPCPPPQEEPKEHRYFFTLYALDTMLDLPEGASRDAVEKALQPHIIEQTQLMGRYKRK